MPPGADFAIYQIDFILKYPVAQSSLLKYQLKSMYTFNENLKSKTIHVQTYTQSLM